MLGTAGHVDHGKTALVFALTGKDTDRLPEEKSRGITIDLGFAALALQDPAGSTVEVSLIDVPGHHAFIRNMLAGAGGIDCVMLVIAADEGVKPQTEEHLAICSLLGIHSGLVALTKKDAVSPERLQAARDEVGRFLQHSFLANAPVLAVSAFTREGIPELKAALSVMASTVPARSKDGVTRIPVDRVFSMRGFGTVVTGTLQAGAIRAGHLLELQPGARAVRVRGLQVHGATREEATAPNRVALNLASVEVAEVKRGDMLLESHTLQPSTTIDVEVCMLAGAQALRHRQRVHVHAFSADTPATVLLYPARPENNGSAGIARLRLERAMMLAPGDRFVLRQPSPATTIGGGRVLDAQPLPRLKKAAASAWLERVRDADRDTQILLRIERRGLAGTSIAQLVAETGLRTETVLRCVAPLLASGSVVREAEAATVDRVLTRRSVEDATRIVLKEISRAQDAPVSPAQLRSRTGLQAWVCDLVLRALADEQRVQLTAGGVRLAGDPQANAAQERRLRAVDSMYAQAGLASPIFSEAVERLKIPPSELRAAITVLLRQKKLVRMGSDDLLVHADALARLTSELRQYRGEQFDVARFKNLTRLTRKHAIPILEYLDGVRVMKNQQGTRIVL